MVIGVMTGIVCTLYIEFIALLLLAIFRRGK